LRIGIRRQTVPELFDALAYAVDPAGEVFGDQFVGWLVFGIDFERKAAERAAVLALGLKDAFAVSGQNCEDPFDWLGRAGEYRVDYDRP
jgi:hypothetical protein